MIVHKSADRLDENCIQGRIFVVNENAEKLVESELDGLADANRQDTTALLCLSHTSPPAARGRPADRVILMRPICKPSVYIIQDVFCRRATSPGVIHLSSPVTPRV
jgi:hypothetical protein